MISAVKLGQRTSVMEGNEKTKSDREEQEELSYDATNGSPDVAEEIIEVKRKNGDRFYLSVLNLEEREIRYTVSKSRFTIGN